MTSRFQLHIANYKDCQLCDLCQGRRRTVFARGSLPSDVLMLGEAPGESEEALGIPFKGPAGKVLDSIINQSLRGLYTFSITNMVLCIPREEDGGKTAEPPDYAIEACTPRLQEFVEIADPKLIVAVGKVAYGWLEPGYKHSIGFHKQIPLVEIMHPAAMLRSPVAAQNLNKRRAIVIIANSINEIVNGGEDAKTTVRTQLKDTEYRKPKRIYTHGQIYNGPTDEYRSPVPGEEDIPF